MRIDDVKLFERVAALGSVSQAGKILGLTPTQATESLKRLEHDLGTTLAHRTTRQLSLSESGRSFLPQAQHLIETYEETRASVGKRMSEPHGMLWVSAPSLFGRLFLERPMLEYLNRYPKAGLTLDLNDRIMDYTKEGIDLAITVRALPDSSMRARKLSNMSRVVCASPEYLEKYGAPQSPYELKDHNCIRFGGETHWLLSSKETDLSIPISGRLASDNADLIRMAVLEGQGLAVRSLWDVHKDLKEGRLVRVLDDFEASKGMAIWAVFPPGAYISASARVFADLVEVELKQRLKGIVSP